MALQLNQLNINWQAIEKFPVRNKLIILAVLCGLIGGLFFYFMYLPQQKQLDKLNADLETAQRQYNEKKAIADNLQTFQEEVRRLNEKLAQALTKLPSTTEIDKILIDVPNLAKEEELVVATFRPGKEGPKGFYAEIPLTLQVQGGYNRIAKFLEKVGKLNRIISIGNISLSTQGKATAVDAKLNADISALTYKFVENGKADSKDKGKGKK
jgi:type IV pilus assembly protein PilO